MSTTASTSDGYVLSWTYDLAEYDEAVSAFARGKRKRPPKPDQMWVDSSEAAERIKAEFLAAHPRGGIKVEAGPKPKKQSRMFLRATVTGVRTTTMLGEVGP